MFNLWKYYIHAYCTLSTCVPIFHCLIAMHRWKIQFSVDLYRHVWFSPENIKLSLWIIMTPLNWLAGWLGVIIIMECGINNGNLSLQIIKTEWMIGFLELHPYLRTFRFDSFNFSFRSCEFDSKVAVSWYWKGTIIDTYRSAIDQCAFAHEANINFGTLSMTNLQAARQSLLLHGLVETLAKCQIL